MVHHILLLFQFVYFLVLSGCLWGSLNVFFLKKKNFQQLAVKAVFEKITSKTEPDDYFFLI